MKDIDQIKHREVFLCLIYKVANLRNSVNIQGHVQGHIQELPHQFAN